MCDRQLVGSRRWKRAWYSAILGEPGEWTEAEFVQAVKWGKKPDGGT